MLIPRDYQLACIKAHYDYFAERLGNPIFCVPTGGGKSLIIAEFVRGVIEQWPTQRIIILTHVKELIEQNYREFLNQWGILAPVGIYSAGMKRRDTDDSVIFAGIQSVWPRLASEDKDEEDADAEASAAKRSKKPIDENAEALGVFDLVLIDEVHLVPKTGMGRYRAYLQWLTERNPALKIIGYTATPYRMEGGLLHKGEGSLFTDLAYNVSLKKLIDDGYLAPLVSRKPKNTIDTTGVGTSGGDYKPGELELAAIGEGNVRPAVEEMVQIARQYDRKHWLVFACGHEHARQILEWVRAFVPEMRSELIFGTTPAEERAQIVSDAKAGKIGCLINVGVLCLDSKTEILCREGWVGIDEMRPDSMVANWQDGSIFFSKPKAIVRRNRLDSERMVALASRTMNVRVTEHHNMLHKYRGVARFSLKRAIDIIGKNGTMPVCGVADPDRSVVVARAEKKTAPRCRVNSIALLNRRAGHSAVDARQMATDFVSRTETATQPASLTSSECWFIGFWVGDGGFYSPKNGGLKCVLSQSTAYPSIIKKVDSVLSDAGLDHNRRVMNGRHPHIRWEMARGTGGRSQHRNGYSRLEPYMDKNGSDAWWGLSKEQFKSLLLGFWYADGDHGPGESDPRTIRISNTNFRLLSTIQAIAVCRGFRADITIGKSRNERHKPLHRITIRERSTHCMGTKTNQTMQVESGWVDERVWCVTSDSGNIITRRNGKVCVTGNTTGFNWPRCDLIGFMRPTKSTSLYVQVLGRGMRTFPGKEDCLVLDYGENVITHGPINDINITDGWVPEKGDGNPKAKTCPECMLEVGLATVVCECGFVFPTAPKKAMHTGRASDAQPIDFRPKAIPKQRVAVQSVNYYRHQKEGKPDSLRVEYTCGFHNFSEWVCVEHGGYAGRKAAEWWLSRAGRPAPLTVSEAIARSGEPEWPSHIVIQKDGKYDRVVECIFRSPWFANNASDHGSNDDGKGDDSVPF